MYLRYVTLTLVNLPLSRILINVTYLLFSYLLHGLLALFVFGPLVARLLLPLRIQSLFSLSN
jgi:hypothetical protein